MGSPILSGQHIDQHRAISEQPSEPIAIDLRHHRHTVRCIIADPVKLFSDPSAVALSVVSI
jgi:hypothetical protein